MWKVVVAFLFWAGLTFIYEDTTKQFIFKATDGLDWEKILLVTVLQAGTGTILFILIALTNYRNFEFDYSMILIGFIHSFGVLLLNCSYLMGNSTCILQVCIVVFTAVFSVITRNIVLNIKSIIQLSLISVLMFYSIPNPNTFSLFTIVVISSGISFAITNTGVRYGEDPKGKERTTIEGFSMLAFGGFLSLLPLVFFMFCFDGNFITFLNITANNWNIIELLIMSSVGHMLSNIISITVILDLFNPVQHALLNAGKAALIVLCSNIVMKPYITSFNFFFAMLSFFISILSINNANDANGGTNGKLKNEKETSNKILGKITLPSLCVFVLYLNSKFSSDALEPAQVEVEKTANQIWGECIDDIQSHIMRFVDLFLFRNLNYLY